MEHAKDFTRNMPGASHERNRDIPEKRENDYPMGGFHLLRCPYRRGPMFSRM